MLNEPNYGPEPDYPTIYASENVRIEFITEQMQFTEAGERVDPTSVIIYIENPVLEEDRITVLTSDDANLIGTLYLVRTVQPAWNAIGNVHHYEVEVMTH